MLHSGVATTLTVILGVLLAISYSTTTMMTTTRLEPEHLKKNTTQRSTTTTNNSTIMHHDADGNRMTATCNTLQDETFVPDCCAVSVGAIEELNRQTVAPLLHQIVQTPYFAHFKLDLCTTCQLWDDRPMCTMHDCTVCECDNAPTWSYINVDAMPRTGPDTESCSSSGVLTDETQVVTTVESSLREGWPPSPQHDDLLFSADPFAAQPGAPSLADDTAHVVDLRLNPERFTGYTGPSAEKVWSAVHSINCFQPPTPSLSGTVIEGDEEDTRSHTNNNDDAPCVLTAEQRLYNRFISGLHSSISLHIAHSYCLEMSPTIVGECARWGRNDTLAYDRVLQYPDRLENLYVAFAIVLRAVIKAGDAITAAVPAPLNAIDDNRVDPHAASSITTYWHDTLLPELMALPETCPTTFNETAVFGANRAHLDTAELQRRFQQLTTLMECVGCDRCKLWGTLQILGMGTALRIIFHPSDEKSLELSRQESVALVNTLERLSSSLDYAYDFRQRRTASIEHKQG